MDKVKLMLDAGVRVGTAIRECLPMSLSAFAEKYGLPRTSTNEAYNGLRAATPAQIADAVRAGAKMSTHLGNGSHAKIDRHPNYIWEQLGNDDLWASFIVDGHHLPPSVIKCFLRSKGIARSILVTDAIAAAGQPAGRYKLGNVEVEVTEAGRVYLPGTPYLAGSALEMHDAIGKTVAYSDATLDESLRMASANPAQLLGLAGKLGTIEAGRRADLVLFEWDEKGWQAFVSDPEVAPIMKEAGHTSKALSATLAGRFSA